MPVIGKLEPASVPEHVRTKFSKLNPVPARSTILAKPAALNGAPRSEVKTKGDSGSCSRCKRSTTILTNSRQRPWTRDGFGSSFNKAKIAAGMRDGDLHFHDLRGTAATRFYVAGLSERVIAEIMGWEEEHVARIIRRYVDRTAATKAIIRQLNEKRT